MNFISDLVRTVLSPVEMAGNIVTTLLMPPKPGAIGAGALTGITEEEKKKRRKETLLEKERKRLARKKTAPPTVLTSPLGLTGAAPTLKPTLLGG